MDDHHHGIALPWLPPIIIPPQSNPPKPWCREAWYDLTYIVMAWWSLGPRTIWFWLVVLMVVCSIISTILHGVPRRGI